MWRLIALSILSLVCICGPSRANAAPAAYGLDPFYSRTYGQSLTKRFSYSSGWGPGGHSVSENDEGSPGQSAPPSTTGGDDTIAVEYERNGRVNDCSSCERALERVREELEDGSLREMTHEETARVERKIAALLDTIKKWRAAKARSRSKRSFQYFVVEEKVPGNIGWPEKGPDAFYLAT